MYGKSLNFPPGMGEGGHERQKVPALFLTAQNLLPYSSSNRYVLRLYLKFITEYVSIYLIEEVLCFHGKNVFERMWI